ncbi:8398_t:CDS:2 [Funneliformis mosseae]|uniref:8398_t:CDS:1 n=1 Tax=Funneliformis mosseae TaxID=27381 RepID=A0A9N9EEM4_FUNMO|nr:8398_t:CDS:2 [Funneliformis mosseae]
MSLKTMSSLQTDGANKKYAKATKKINFLAKFAKYLVNNQIDFPVRIIALLSLMYLLKFPGADKFFLLQHEDPKTGLYKKGRDDVYFVFTWVVLFTSLRAATMKYLLSPIAKLCGIKKNTQQIRFAEQGWSFLYYSIFWTLGMYVMSKSPYWFDTTYFWKGYPHIEMSGLFKWYYLVQLAFWIQQVFVINIEKRRKDFVEMVAHHAITISLIYFSYLMNFTRIGNAVLCTMDFVDLILPFAKMLKYCGFNVVCDYVFGFFMLSWVVTRHYFYGCIIYSTWTEPQQLIEFKWAPEEEYYVTENSMGFFLTLFLFLQALIYFWFYLICRVAYRVIKGDNAHDNRSDSEWEETEANTNFAKEIKNE